jgi:5-methylcytosine-specific restriction endonuclease McrA
MVLVRVCALRCVRAVRAKTVMDGEAWREVVERDQRLCICGAAASQVHHIIPRSRTSHKHEASWLWSPQNLICLCPTCHGEAHSRTERARMMEYLAEKFGYSYNFPPFSEY